MGAGQCSLCSPFPGNLELGLTPRESCPSEALAVSTFFHVNWEADKALYSKRKRKQKWKKKKEDEREEKLAMDSLLYFSLYFHMSQNATASLPNSVGHLYNTIIHFPFD